MHPLKYKNLNANTLPVHIGLLILIPSLLTVPTKSQFSLSLWKYLIILHESSIKKSKKQKHNLPGIEKLVKYYSLLSVLTP